MQMNALATRLLVALVILLGTACTTDTTLVVKSVDYVPIDVADSALAPDAEAQALIDPYRSKLDAEMNQVLNTADMVMEKAQPEGLLGNFVADLTLVRAQTEYSSHDNHGPDFCPTSTFLAVSWNLSSCRRWAMMPVPLATTTSTTALAGWPT